MNTRKFSEAMGEINDKYVVEAISYNPKSKTTLHRRLSIAMIAAILALLLIGAGVAAIIDHLSQEIELSQTTGNVTVTVDSATIGYDNFFLLLRVDGPEFSGRHGYSFENVIMNKVFIFRANPAIVSVKVNRNICHMVSQSTQFFNLNYLTINFRSNLISAARRSGNCFSFSDKIASILCSSALESFT